MMQNRAGAVGAVFFVALALCGCVVVVDSVNLPDAPRFVDDRLVGAWRSVDDYLHFQRLGNQNALRLIGVGDDGFSVYEFTTMRIGDNQVFAAKLVDSVQDAKESGKPATYIVGFYEVKGSEFIFYTLHSDKIKRLIQGGLLEGIVSDDSVTLTGSPTALSAFLASPEADDARDEVSRYHRLAD